MSAVESPIAIARAWDADLSYVVEALARVPPDFGDARGHDDRVAEVLLHLTLLDREALAALGAEPPLPQGSTEPVRHHPHAHWPVFRLFVEHRQALIEAANRLPTDATQSQAHPHGRLATVHDLLVRTRRRGEDLLAQLAEGLSSAGWLGTA